MFGQKNDTKFQDFLYISSLFVFSPSCFPEWLHTPSWEVCWDAEPPELLLSSRLPSWWTSWPRLPGTSHRAPGIAHKTEDHSVVLTSSYFEFKWAKIEKRIELKLLYRVKTYAIAVSVAFFIMSQSVYVISSEKRTQSFWKLNFLSFFGLCVVFTYTNSKWMAYSLDIYGIWSSASLFANKSALSQCNNSLLI